MVFSEFFCYMLFNLISVTVSTEEKEESIQEDVDVNGATLILGRGRHLYGALTVTFTCKVSLITEVSQKIFRCNGSVKIFTNT